MTKTGRGKYRLETVVSFAKTLPNVQVERGRRHPYLLKYTGADIGNCAMAKSTQEHYLLSWFRRVCGYSNHEIRQGMRTGTAEA